MVKATCGHDCAKATSTSPLIPQSRLHGVFQLSVRISSPSRCRNDSTGVGITFLTPTAFSPMRTLTHSVSLLVLLGLVGLAVFPVPGCTKPASQALQEAALPETISFNAHVRPILAQNCMACHGGVKKSGNISWVFEEEAITTGSSGKPAVVRGDPDASYMIEKVLSTDPAVRMPPPEHGPALTPRQVALLKKWIEQGAPWEEHWAFVPPSAPTVPQLEDDTWSRNDTDRFILRRLRREGLTPSAQAPRGALLRRVSLDLTGLPPTEAEYDAFAADDAPDAYERAVDRLLQSPAYGERWATLWLDLARYADSKGLGQDKARPTIYKYRDWVIRAFNQDMPFDDFTVKQIAGDLLPNPTLDDFVATAFHRNTPSQDEGGTNDEEFRITAQMDRVSTTWQVWHGTTMSCVQCHAHPYDAIRHDDYFRFMDFFNQTQDGDLNGEAPRLSVPVSPERQAEVGATVARQRQITRQLWEQAADLADADAWRWLDGMTSKSNRDAQLSFEPAVREGREELVFEGTPTRIDQTVTAPLPTGDGPLQALRLEVAPEDLQTALAKPSPGFRLDRFSAALVRADGQRQPVKLSPAHLDEPFPLEGRSKNRTGFAALNYQFHTRWAVFPFAEPVEVGPGDRIELKLNHGSVSAENKDLLLMRRISLAVTDDSRWAALQADPDRHALEKQRAALTKTLTQGPQAGVPVMVERPDHLRRETRTFIRGNWTTMGDLQTAGVPEVFHPLPDTDEPDRLRMARWLVDEANPLSARVLVARFWQQLFGTGLVETLEDFGSVGAEPSHPELLDFLALRLMHEHQWSMKSLLRELVTSAAYRQTANATPELIERDPDNRLLARGPRNRLTGEMVRDQVLALGGQLNPKMFGPAVRPQLPTGGWSPSHPAAGTWEPSTPEAAQRRSIYVHWQRSSVYPLFTAFDAPARDLCVDRRTNSNTPLQPLFTLNDPALFAATQSFARRIQAQAGELPEQIAWAYRLATGRPPSDEVLATLVKLHGQTAELYPKLEDSIRKNWEEDLADHYAEKREAQEVKNRKVIARAKKAKKPEPTDLPDPELIRPGPDDVFDYDAQRAAYDNVASVIMNLDLTLQK